MVVKLGGRGPGHKSRTPPGTTTAALTLSGLSTPETSTAGTLIGTLSTVGTTGTPVYALDNSAGSKAAISGANINRGATALSYATASFFDITVSVTGVTPSIAPTTFRIAVTSVSAIDPDPARFGMPTESTTGIQAGVTLTAYSGPTTITTPGTLVENKIIDGTLTIGTLGEITIRNCRFQNFSFWGLNADGTSNITVDHCEFVGEGSTATSAYLGGGTLTNNHVHGMAIGFQMSEPGTVQDNCIHGLLDPNPETHFDAITVFRNTGPLLIQHNTLETPALGGTADVFIKNEFGSIDSVTVNNNLLIGKPSYSIYVEESDARVGTITNVTLSSNYIQKGLFGYYNIVNTEPVLSGNITWDPDIDPTPYP